MTLLDSLLDAIVRLDGEALVMHAGEKPYVVLSSASTNTFRGPLAWGQVELSSRPLTADAVLSMLAQMLSANQSHTLEEFGAIEHVIDAPGDSGERFVVTAARGGEDVWVEVRRQSKVTEPAPVPQPVAAADAQPHAAAHAEPLPAVPAAIEQKREPVAREEPELEITVEPGEDTAVHEIGEGDAALTGLEEEINGAPVFEIALTPPSIQREASRVMDDDEHEASIFDIEADGALLELTHAPAMPPPKSDKAGQRFIEERAEQTVADVAQQKVIEIAEQRVAALAERKVGEIAEQQIMRLAEEQVARLAEQQVAQLAARKVAQVAEQTIAQLAQQTVTQLAEQTVARVAQQRVAEIAEQKVTEIAREKVTEAAEVASAAIVVPHRPVLKLHQAQSTITADASKEASLVELLRAAASYGASTLYAVVDTRPMMRVDGHISVVGTYAPIAAGEVERFVFEFAARDQLAVAEPEWTSNVPDVGRVRCVTFRDHSGSGLICHLPAADLSPADDNGLADELQSLCAESDGLVVVAGPRSSGKSTMLAAFVDLINRTRYDHVITIESQILKVHERGLSLISQREVHGDGDAIASAARAALREGPDVLVIEDLRAPEALIAALDAARAGRLVFGSLSARTAPAAIDRLIDGFPPDRRPQVRASLSGSLRAVIAQVLVPKPAGGRVAAREILLSSPAVRKLVLDGAIDQLPIAIETGRALGMRTMVDALGALVHDAVVEIGDACASAPDRAALVAALERDGINVTGAERRA